MPENYHLLQAVMKTCTECLSNATDFKLMFSSDNVKVVKTMLLLQQNDANSSANTLKLHVL